MVPLRRIGSQVSAFAQPEHSFATHRGIPVLFVRSPEASVNAPDRRSVSLAGLSLIGAGAVLGLALVVPASPAAAAPPPPAGTSSTVDKDR
jgi:hypothetical protein